MSSPFHALVAASNAVRTTRSRKAKTQAIAAYLASLEAGEVGLASAVLAGEMRQGKIGVGPALLREIDVAPSVESSLPLAAIDERLQEIRDVVGKGAKARRRALVEDLLRRATREEQAFLRGLMVGELRQGALESMLAGAIAEAFDLGEDLVRRALMLSGSVARVAADACTRGREALEAYRLELHRPVQPMLAQTAASPADALERLGGRGAFEWKLDGARIQVHRKGDVVRVFTRSLHDVTAAVPEVTECVARLDVETIVLDGEAIAMRADGRPHSFQTTMKRFGRRLDVARMRDELPIVPFFFDCLELDGRELLDLPAEARREAWASAVPEDTLVPRVVTDDVAQAEDFYDAAIASGHEGVVAKSLDATYEAGKRGVGWLKLKPAHTLDLVVLAVEPGSGRREGTLSNIHLGVRDPETGGFAMVGKTFKGMTDEVLAWQTKRFRELETDTLPEHLDSNSQSWVVPVRPEIVAEIAFDSVLTSPNYPSGLALRFARLKGYRLDKVAADADTLDTLRTIADRNAAS